MKVACAITTAPRRVDYLPKAIESIEESGFLASLISSDGRWGAPTDLPLIVGERLGPLGNFRQALRLLLNSETLADLFLVFQDDIFVTRDLAQHLIWPSDRESIGCISLYSSGRQGFGDGWREVDLQPTDVNPVPWHTGCLGACALAMPKHAARRFLRDNPWPERTDKIGATVGEWCYSSGLSFVVHHPSYVQHVGDVSCLHEFGINPDRQAGEFLDTASGFATEACSL